MLYDTKVFVNGIDISDKIAHRGVSWSWKRRDGGQGGMMLDGRQQVDVLANKAVLEITTIPLKLADLRSVQQLLLPAEIPVYYDDPVFGIDTKTMHCTGSKATFVYIRSTGEMWDSISFTLEEL